MKKIATLLLIVCSLAFSVQTQAQTKGKLGHIDFATLYSMMPGLDSVKAIFEEYNKNVQQQYADMQTELQNKFADYQANSASMSDIIRSTKEAEINDLKDRMDSFEQTATQDLQKKEADLTAPIIDKAKKAVQEVANEKGYSYIFNSTEGLLLFANPSDNIMDLVKAKLGITMPTPSATDVNPALPNN